MDDDQQFCLRWNNHQSTLISVFDTLLENGTLVDCTLAAEGKFLKAHKVVLSACSPYFATLLSQQYDKHPIFILKDVKFQELRAMMDYMYRGEVNISQDQLAALLKAAESLQIKGLSDSRGGSSTQKPTNEHKTLSVPVAGKGGSSTGYTLEQKRPRHTLDTQELSGSREGSSSPTSRKRKKIRRRSVDNVMADNHEHSNSSSHSMQVNSSIIPSSNTSAAIASISATAATSLSTSSTVAAISGTVGAVTGINVTKKTENMSNAKIGSIECENDDDDDDDNDDELDENDKQIGVVKKEQTKRKSHAESDPNKDGSDMLIEPKSEYDDGNDETVEDLTLDDEELLEDLDQAGPSHGGGEGSSQGYAQWQVDRSSQDEVFMAAQDAAGQQRDPQDKLRHRQHDVEYLKRLNDISQKYFTNAQFQHDSLLQLRNKMSPELLDTNKLTAATNLVSQIQQNPDVSIIADDGAIIALQEIASFPGSKLVHRTLPQWSKDMQDELVSSIQKKNNIPSQNCIQTTKRLFYETNRCPLCSRNYRSQAFLNEHMRKEHSVLI